MKSSLWSFANIASTVCVSDDASCEKIRLSLEGCEVEKDIRAFIREKGTGQEIPDPPRFINFCRGDVNDGQSEASEDDAYSVAQFQRVINPAFRSSSPQPSTYESHHEPHGHPSRPLQIPQPDPNTPPSRETTLTPQTATQRAQRAQHNQLAAVPHNQYPMDGMTMLCRTGPPSERSSATSPARRSSHDSQSEYSNPTSFSSQEQSTGQQSPTKQSQGAMSFPNGDDRQVQKKKSGFFQGHSPFRRKSKHEKEHRAMDQQQPAIMAPLQGRNTWSAASARNGASLNGSPSRRDLFGQDSQAVVLGGDRQSGSPEPVDPRANFQLNVGRNVFDVASPDGRRDGGREPVKRGVQDEMDPIAQALADLKGVTKQSSVRMSADRYHGLQTPAPSTTSNVSTPTANGLPHGAQRGTPPPSYDQPMKRLDLPQPAFTSAAMQQTRQKYVDQAQNVFGRSGAGAETMRGGNGQYGTRSQSRPGTRGSGGSHDVPRATSPAPPRATSPRPAMYGDQRHGYRSESPNPYGNGGRSRTEPNSPVKRVSDQGYSTRHHQSAAGQYAGGPDMQVQSSGPDDGYGGSQRSRAKTGGSSNRPMSYYGGAAGQQTGGASSRGRSKSMSDGRQFTRDGRPILHFGEYRLR